MSGLLAIWNNVNKKFLNEYEDWYNNEHLFERLSVPDINIARRFISLNSNYKYFTSYEAKNSKTFYSSEYINKLNNPTTKTKFVMEFVFKNMSRTVFERKVINGSVRGAFCLIIAIKERIEKEVLIQYEKNNKSHNQVYSEIWLSREIKGFETSKEESLRGKDNKFNSCLYIEFCNENDAVASMKNADKNFKNSEIGTYKLISYLY
ncbi:hypothetical protein N8725_02690 [Alphaproteobacteria bacterium]|nr:hypothetical protein [Alphaproteobacteria bacterium]